MHIQIRQLRENDIPIIQSVGRASYEPYYSYLWNAGGMEWYLHRCFNKERLEKELTDTNIAYFLAETNTGDAIGFMKIFWQKSVPTIYNSKASLIEKLYLLPNFLGQGKGRFLTNWLLLKSKALGKDYLWLDVMKSGTVKAYEAAGFSIISEKEIPFEFMKLEERHLWIMAKQI